MTYLPLYQVDAFTSRPWRGNPAAVCLLEGSGAEGSPAEPDALLQAIASEMNLSETAFIRRQAVQPWADSQSFALRWFTPITEVRLCGHATLATAAVLFNALDIAAPEITFHTLSGPLRARNTPEGIALNFPRDMPQPCDAPPEVLQALDVEVSHVVEAASATQSRKLLLHLDDESLVRDLTPDYPTLLRIPAMQETYMGLIVTARGETAPYDFVSRFFAPWVGINEDPVTGSAHTVLTPYWAERLGRQTMRAYQASARGGELTVQLSGEDRVTLIGDAVIVFSGNLHFQL